MASTSKKAVKKDLKKKATKRSPHAGKIAPLLVEPGATARPAEKHLPKPFDLGRILREAALAPVQHRRVKVEVLDSKGHRIVGATYDLAKDDHLLLSIDEKEILATTNEGSR